MQSVKKYSREYINECKRKIKADADEFQKIKAATPSFENIYFRNLILVLEQMFVHRMRGEEGKDGNPLNEVRILSNSILTNNCRLESDNTIRYHLDKSILRIDIGGVININAKDFGRLAKAYFEEIEKKFS